MNTYKITYKCPDGRVESDYFPAPNSSEAKYEFEFRYAKCQVMRISKAF